ncbi:hypothetical protein BDV18DRAFT_158535 [Aspergillus unguis]
MASESQQPSAEFLAESQAPTVKAVMWLMAGMATLFLFLRLYVRLHLKRVFGWDDLIAAVAAGCLLGYAAVCHAASDVGLGWHIQRVSQNPQYLVDVARYSSISQCLAIMACTLGKTSFAVTLLRIVFERWMTWLLWFVIITMNVVNILAALFVFLQCKDPRSNWDPSVVSDCWPDYVFMNFSLFVGAYSGAQDFLLALLPWTIVWRLQMKKKEKMGIAVAMSLGIFAGAAAIVKTTYLVKLSAKADFTWEMVPLLNWAAAEDGLTIIAAAIPTLKPLLTKLFPSSTVQESYNMLPPRAYEKKRNVPIRFDTSLYATQVDRGRGGGGTELRDNSSQQSILPATHRDHTNEINLTTEVSVVSKPGAIDDRH